MNITQENYSNKLKELQSQSLHERDTQTVLELFFVFNNWDDERIRKSGSRIDNPNVYQYEIVLNKKLFEMSPDELLDMIKGFKGKGTQNISHTTYKAMYHLCNNVWSFYSENIELIKNPWLSPKLQIDTVIDLLSSERQTITTDYLESAIDAAHIIYSDKEHYWEYGEMFVRLLYDGVESVQEALSINESQIDFIEKQIKFPYKTVHLSNRTIYLLKINHSLDPFIVYRETLFPVSYNKSYIHVIVKRNFKESIDSRPINSVAQGVLNFLKKYMDRKITAKQIYKLGFFDFAVSQIGEDAIRTILSENNREDNRTLIRLSAEYGYPVQTTAGIRNDLREFL